MIRLLSISALAAAFVLPAACGPRIPTVPGEMPDEVTIVLDGERTHVKWSDGDSFKILDGAHKGEGTRLARYNSLESYGPVHRWGGWTAKDLYEIAGTSKYLAASKTWTCTSSGDEGGYGRLLVDCPDLAETMVAAGHGHVYVIDGEADPDLLDIQLRAQRKRVGIWKRGVPDSIITSLHSPGEQRDSEDAYDRYIDTRTGLSTTREHRDTYAICQEVCGEGKSGSCMVYVPFALRYRNKPDCLK